VSDSQRRDDGHVAEGSHDRSHAEHSDVQARDHRLSTVQRQVLADRRIRTVRFRQPDKRKLHRLLIYRLSALAATNELLKDIFTRHMLSYDKRRTIVIKESYEVWLFCLSRLNSVSVQFDDLQATASVTVTTLDTQSTECER